jgi:gamma-glutamyltranspeptidase/glutathione hydrolase
MRKGVTVLVAAAAFGLLASSYSAAQARRTVKPVLHGRHWVAITGKPLAATAGALTYAKGGNAADAAAAMLAAACTMWDTLGWGGETQALVYDPRTKKVTGLNALGVARPAPRPSTTRARGTVTRPSSGRSPP